MNKFTKQSESNNEINRRKNNLRDGIGVSAILLVALLIGSAPQANPGDLAARDIIWATVSILGVVALLFVSYLGYRRADELQRIIQLKAAALTLMIILLGLFTTEMLYALKQIHVIPLSQGLFIGSILLWMVLQKLIERRTR